MTRAQFLNDLYRRLAGSGMDAEQAEQHLTYYAEMLADRMEEGMDEGAAVESMEDVDTIARRILEEEGLPYRPPAYPDPPGPGGGGKRAYRVPKRRMRPAQIVLWAVAILCALGAVGRWVFLGFTQLLVPPNVSGYTTTAVDRSSSVPIQVAESSEAPLTEAYEDYIWDRLPYDYGYMYCSDTTFRSGGSLNKLSIAWAAGMVYVRSWGGDEILIQEYARSELTERTSMVVEDGEAAGNRELAIRYRNGTSLGNVKGDKWLTVLVPDGMVNELEIETTSAEVWMHGVEQGELNITTTSGHIDLTECYVRGARLGSVSGDMDVAGVYADALDVSSTSGHVAGDVHCNDVEVGTISGYVNLSTRENTQRIHVTTTSGEVYLGLSNSAMESVSVDTTSGDVSLSIPYEFGFALRYSTVSGDFNDNWIDENIRQDGRMVYNGGGCEITVDTVSGGLDIY